MGSWLLRLKAPAPGVGAPSRAWRHPGPWLVAAGALALVACGAPVKQSDPAGETDAAQARPLGAPHPERRGIGLLPVEGVRAQGVAEVRVDPRRSLAVTEQALLARFSFQEVMERLAEQSGIPGLTGLQLYQEWWDTQRAAPGLGRGSPHCDDERLPNGQPGFNGFPYTCSRIEGQQAEENPFLEPETNPGAYVPIGLFNRFDLAAQDGSDCGEYRLAFARRSGIAEPRARNLILFEAVLPNPRPQLGLFGCRPVARFWAALSAEPDVQARAEALHRFYFEGLPGGFPPVVHIDNLGHGVGRPTGQVRTNQFMQFGWTLREFRVRKRCEGEVCVMRFEPDTVKTNPAGLLFSPSASHPLKADFQQQAFPSQVAALAVNDLFRFSLHMEDRFNSGQSNSTGTDNSYLFLLGQGASPLRTRLQQELQAQGSRLTPANLVARAQALSCAGCHQLSNRADLGGGLTWPFKSTAFAFVHVSERTTEEGPDGPRYALSEALTGTFLPHRQQVLEAFLEERPPFGPPPGNGAGCASPQAPWLREEGSPDCRTSAAGPSSTGR